MDKFLSTMQHFSESNDFYSIISFLYKKEKAGDIVLYAGTYSFKLALERFGSYDDASFYIYTKEAQKGYHVYLNRMGCGVIEDQKMFKFSHRYLYNKGHLSNCFFGEEDYRCGVFFKKKEKK